ncbi:hypothetical protein ACIPY0_01640 [Paenarthrobacter nicotinovorans]|uniref:hypothetical protein n=1 Tax=Paenarthrobacter nicotinovorans TaxID=29320 RepID=UPI0037FD3A61
MKPLQVGLMADPAAPTQLAHRLCDLKPPGGKGHPEWNIEVVSEPFSTGSEDVDTALARLRDHARDHEWDVVIGLTELPFRDEDDGRYLLAETDPGQRAAVLSLPALGGIRMHRRGRHAVRSLVSGMDGTAQDEESEPLPRFNSTVWLLAGSLSPWRLIVAMLASIALVVGWLVVDAGLWDKADDNSAATKERSRLYNTSTLITLTIGVVICYLALYVVNLAWALFVLDPAVMGGYLKASLDYGDLFILTWFVASAATVGGALGSGLESEEAVRAAAYSKREEERRNTLADEGDDK